MRAAGRLRWPGPATRECHQRRRGRARTPRCPHTPASRVRDAMTWRLASRLRRRSARGFCGSLRDEAKQVRFGTAKESPGRKRRATALDRRQPTRWIHDDRHETESEDREQRDVELCRHWLEEQHAVAAAQTAPAQERGTLLRLVIELGERECPGRATVTIDDGGRVGTCCDLRRQHLDDVHGSARANNVYRRIVCAYRPLILRDGPASCISA